MEYYAIARLFTVGCGYLLFCIDATEIGLGMRWYQDFLYFLKSSHLWHRSEF
jgi:hypothetical protein